MAYRAWGSNAGSRILRVPTWKLVLILIAALAVGIAVAIVATGIFLVALPIAIVAGLAYRLFGKRRRAPGHSIIEGEYEVIDAAPAGSRPGKPRL
jgi:hypothetical protein